MLEELRSDIEKFLTNQFTKQIDLMNKHELVETHKEIHSYDAKIS